MSFNSNSLKRLRDLEQKLSKECSDNENQKQNKNQSSAKLHPIETEKNPELLFHELIKASEDGNIPQHLINRLQEIETRNYNQVYNYKQNPLKNKSKGRQAKQNKKELSNQKQKDLLYAEFNRLILEDDD